MRSPSPDAVAQLQPAHVRVAAVLLRPDVGHQLVGDRGRPSGRPRPPRLRSGYVSTGPGAEPGQPPPGPVTASSTVPTRGRSSSSPGSRRSRRPGCQPSANAVRTCSCATAMPAPVRTGGPHDRARPVRGRRARPRGSAGRGPGPPSGRPCRRSGRCRSAPATAPGAARPPAAGAGAGHRRPRTTVAGADRGRPARSGPAGNATCAQPTSKPGVGPTAGAAVRNRIVSQTSWPGPGWGATKPGDRDRPCGRPARARAAAARLPR